LGPVSAFAGRLWRLKQEAGDPSYEEMSVRLGAAASRSSLAAAAKGRSLPSWETTWEFVRVLAVDRLGRDPRVTEREWREHWLQARVAGLAAADTAPGVGPAGAAAGPPAIATRTAASPPAAEPGPSAAPTFEPGPSAAPTFEARASASGVGNSAEAAPGASEARTPTTPAAKTKASANEARPSADATPAASEARTSATPAAKIEASASEPRPSADATPATFEASALTAPAADAGASAAVGTGEVEAVVKTGKAAAQAGETGKAEAAIETGKLAAQADETGEFAGSGPIGSRHEPAVPATVRPVSPGVAGRRRFGIAVAVATAAVAVLTSVVLVFVVLARQPDGSGGAGAPPAAAASPDHDDSRFEGDITYPDGTVVPPNSSFTKIWRIRNTGTVFWANRFLGRVNEQPCQAPAVVAVPQTRPGETVDIAVTVRTPAEPGRCKIYWKMADEQGRTLFPLKRPIFLDVQVGGS
jgi:hypothetical protein